MLCVCDVYAACVFVQCVFLVQCVLCVLSGGEGNAFGIMLTSVVAMCAEECCMREVRTKTGGIVEGTDSPSRADQGWHLTACTHVCVCV